MIDHAWLSALVAILAMAGVRKNNDRPQDFRERTCCSAGLHAYMMAQSAASPLRTNSAMPPTTSPAKAHDDVTLLRWQASMFWILMLLLVFMVAAAAIVHFSRRYRTYLVHEKPKPTSVDDVWSMHKLPEEEDDDKHVN